jgi:hypothetical protein
MSLSVLGRRLNGGKGKHVILSGWHQCHPNA